MVSSVKDEVFKVAQRFSEGRISFVFGSGLSAQYGLPTCEELKKSLSADVNVAKSKAFTKFLALSATLSLEEAIDGAGFSEKEIEGMRFCIWDAITKKDLPIFRELVDNRERLAGLLKLVSYALDTSSHKLQIITTNYDRIPEYLADLLEVPCVDGTTGKYRLFVDPSRFELLPKEKCLEVLKVHGSLDWFEKDSTMYRLPLFEKIPDGFSPMIIPPSKAKYAEVSDDPYRTLIQQADSFFKNSDSFLCFGFGFGDKHIQPKLLDQIHGGKPVIVLSKKATDNCKVRLIHNAAPKYLILEDGGAGKTHILSSEKSISNQLIDGEYWTADSFGKEVF